MTYTENSDDDSPLFVEVTTDDENNAINTSDSISDDSEADDDENLFVESEPYDPRKDLSQYVNPGRGRPAARRVLDERSQHPALRLERDARRDRRPQGRRLGQVPEGAGGPLHGGGQEVRRPEGLRHHRLLHQ